MDHPTPAPHSDAAVAATIRRHMGDTTTERQLANETLIPRTTLNRKMQARASFTVSELAGIAAVLGVSVPDLLAEAEEVTA